MTQPPFNPRTIASNRDLLRNMPIEAVVEDVRVTGVIVMVSPTDMVVEITSPTGGFGTTVHVPHMAMPARALAAMSDGVAALTAHGQQQAARLLTELYDHAVGRPSNWTKYAIGADGAWTELPRDDGEVLDG